MADTSLTFSIIARDDNGARAMDRILEAMDDVDDTSRRATKSSMSQFIKLARFAGFRTAAGGVVGIAAFLAAVPSIATVAAGGIVLAFTGVFGAMGLLVAGTTKGMIKQFTDFGGVALRILRNVSRPMRTVLLAALGTGLDVLLGFKQPLTNFFRAIQGPAITLLQSLGDAMLELRPVLPVMADAFGELVKHLGPALPVIVGALADGLIAVSQAVAANPEAFADLALSLAQIASAGLHVIAFLTQFAQVLTGSFSLLAHAVFYVDNFWATWTAAFQGLLSYLQFWGQSMLLFTVTPFRLMVTSVLAVLQGLVGSVRTWLNILLQSVLTSWRILFNVTIGAWAGMIAAIVGKISQMTGIASSIPGRIRSAVGSLGGLLFDAGRSIIEGLIAGIESAASALQSTLDRVTNLIPEWKGPPAEDARLLEPAGQAVMAGVIAGIDAERDALGSASFGADFAGRRMRCRAVTVHLEIDDAESGLGHIIRKMVRVDGPAAVQVA